MQGDITAGVELAGNRDAARRRGHRECARGRDNPVLLNTGGAGPDNRPAIESAVDQYLPGRRGQAGGAGNGGSFAVVRGIPVQQGIALCGDGQAATDHSRRLNIGRTQRRRHLHSRRTTVAQYAVDTGIARGRRQADRTDRSQAAVQGNILVGADRDFITGNDAIGVDRTTRRTQDHIAGRRQAARGVRVARDGRSRGQCQIAGSADGAVVLHAGAAFNHDIPSRIAQAVVKIGDTTRGNHADSTTNRGDIARAVPVEERLGAVADVKGAREVDVRFHIHLPRRSLKLGQQAAACGIERTVHGQVTGVGLQRNRAGGADAGQRHGSAGLGADLAATGVGALVHGDATTQRLQCDVAAGIKGSRCINVTGCRGHCQGPGGRGDTVVLHAASTQHLGRPGSHGAVNQYLSVVGGQAEGSANIGGVAGTVPVKGQIAAVSRRQGAGHIYRALDIHRTLQRLQQHRRIAGVSQRSDRLTAGIGNQAYRSAGTHGAGAQVVAGFRRDLATGTHTIHRNGASQRCQCDVTRHTGNDGGVDRRKQVRIDIAVGDNKAQRTNRRRAAVNLDSRNTLQVNRPTCRQRAILVYRTGRRGLQAGRAANRHRIAGIAPVQEYGVAGSSRQGAGDIKIRLNINLSVGHLQLGTAKRCIQEAGDARIGAGVNTDARRRDIVEAAASIGGVGQRTSRRHVNQVHTIAATGNQIAGRADGALVGNRASAGNKGHIAPQGAQAAQIAATIIIDRQIARARIQAEGGGRAHRLINGDAGSGLHLHGP